MAHLLVIDPDNGRIDDRVVAPKELFHFAWEDILAPRDNHLVVSAFDEQATSFVDITSVTRAHQSGDDLLPTTARVALKSHPATDEDEIGRASCRESGDIPA